MVSRIHQLVSSEPVKWSAVPPPLMKVGYTFYHNVAKIISSFPTRGPLQHGLVTRLDFCIVRGDSNRFGCIDGSRHASMRHPIWHGGRSLRSPPCRKSRTGIHKNRYVTGTYLVQSHMKQNPAYHGYRPWTQLRFISPALIFNKDLSNTYKTLSTENFSTMQNLKTLEMMIAWSWTRPRRQPIDGSFFCEGSTKVIW